VLIICGNMLMDELHLEEREAVAGLLIRLYREQGIVNGEAAHMAATGLFAFAASLPLIA
jgi:predicted HTH domain antitoxin